MNKFQNESFAHAQRLQRGVEFQNLKVVPELWRIYIQSTGSVRNCPINNHPLYILSIDITFMHYALIIIQIELFAMNKPKICFELPTVHYDN